MRTKAETCEHYADQCDSKARAVTDSRLAALFLDLAIQWRGLAAIVRSLEDERMERESFFKRFDIGVGISRDFDP
jgi:hypothetical protein